MRRDRSPRPAVLAGLGLCLSGCLSGCLAASPPRSPEPAEPMPQVIVGASVPAVAEDPVVSALLARECGCEVSFLRVMPGAWIYRMRLPDPARAQALFSRIEREGRTLGIRYVESDARVRPQR